MLKGQAIEISKENFNNIHLAVKKQPVDSSSKENSLKKYEWNVQPSKFAINTTNPIRAIVEHLNVQPNPDKAFIPLSVGDPTVFGNLKAADETIQAVRNAIDEGKHNGYAHSAGTIVAREAVCKYIAPYQGVVAPNDVILCSGCSSSIDICIGAIAEPGKNILIPRPGFSIYRTLAVGHGIEVRSYNLLPFNQWEVDLEQLEDKIDENTAVIVLTNPSNPCGSVFRKKHMLDIIALCEKYCIPIIADEIYEHFVFPGTEYHSFSSLSKNVPVLSCGGLTKRFLVPGWRLGWIIIHDRNDTFKELRQGLANLSTRILGSNTLIQGALPEILEKTPQTFFDSVVDTLYKHAKLAYEILSDAVGLRPIMPDGAMYMMIGIDIENFPEYEDELQFVQALVKEQSVFCLPGQCFDYPNYMRIVLTVPEGLIWESCTRIADFCNKHYKNSFDPNLIENLNW
ncbi:tyrosine aminotransferase [Sitodiplosis mosellana]|uniref:tyrosine aminotransferase n=1 Tax=Sitodiplosis mosellana TaxID=263140 RepID=UPI002444BEC0|nr:tyrosine aminotransferase [Sitodiplosis mosellana]